MRLPTARVLVASIAIVLLCWWMQQRLLGILGCSPFVGKLYTSFFRTFSSSGMSRHTVFKDGEGVFNHGAFTVQPIPVLEDNYAYVSCRAHRGSRTAVERRYAVRSQLR